jgi:hypothetical protein
MEWCKSGVRSWISGPGCHCVIDLPPLAPRLAVIHSGRGDCGEGGNDVVSVGGLLH